jgi:cytochrome oxidase Cu insertion factor (SCO1/SenC/PrrC family)
MEEDLVNDTDPELEKLEQQHARKTAAAANSESTDVDVDFTEDATSDTADEVEEANEMLRKSALLFEFISDPDFCKSITKNMREVIQKHVANLYEKIQELDQTVEELRDGIDEDEEENE